MKDRTPILFLLVLISVFGIHDLSAQTKDTIPTGKFIENFNKNSLLEHKEKLFVHIDRTVFLPGEELWFKAYLVTATDLQSDTLENILYFELKSENDTVLVKRSYKIYSGRVNGVFYLPDSIKAGIYNVSAYTNWMLNDFGGTPYTASIYIYNEPKGKGEKNTDAAKTSNEETITNISGVEAGENTSAQSDINLKFYPEGGALIPELKTLIAFEALDPDGEPVSVEGEIKDDKGNFVTFFKTFMRGRGFFYLQPAPDRKYSAVLKSSDNTEIKVDLPETEKYGFILNVHNPFSEDSVIVDIKARYPGVNNSFYLLGIQEKLVAMAMRGNASKKSYRIKIAKSTFKTGIVTFSLLDGSMLPRCERKIFINHYDSLRISLDVDKTHPEKREPIELFVNVRDKAGEPVSGDFSLSVIDASSISGSMQKEQNISSWFLLKSDLPGLKEDAGSLLLKNENAHSLLDLIMLTNGWQKFVWKKIPDDHKFNPEHEIEKQNWIKGRIYKTDDPEKPGADFSISAFLFGEFNDFYKAQTNKDGIFRLFLLDLFDTIRIQINQSNRMGYDVKNYTMDLESNLTLLKDSDSGNNSYISLNRGNTLKPAEEVPYEIPEILPEIRSIKINTPIYSSELEDLKKDSTTIMINEVEVSGKKPETPQEKITAVYGTPSTVVGSKQIDALMLKHPWRNNLFDVIMDAIPGLKIDVDQKEIDKWYFSNNVPTTIDSLENSEDLSLGVIKNSPLEFGLYSVPRGLVNFNMKDVNGRLIYIFVDGEYIASTNARGWLQYMRMPYEISDLVDVDISNIKSVDLILNIKDNPDKNLLDDYVDLRKDNPVILAIYTKDGRGLYSSKTEKKISNLKILGFVREREFHSPDYSVSNTSSSVLDDRKTLFWTPEVKLDSNGNAKIKFYNSDIATSLRIEMNGISSAGHTGHTLLTIGETKTVSVSEEQNTVHKNIITSPLTFNDNIWDKYLSNFKKNGLTPCIALDEKRKPIPYADVFIKNANIETTANTSGIFAFNSKEVKDDDTILICDAGKRYLSIPVVKVIKNNGIVTVPDAKISKVDINANNLIKEILKANQRPYAKSLTIKATYREQTEKGKYIFSLTDYAAGVVLLRNSRNDMPHVTHIEKGRIFKATNYNQVIDFKPIHPIVDDVIQLTDPLLEDDLYFIREYYKKYLDIKLEGSMPFRGEDVYKISFRQKDNNAYNLYDGFMLVKKNDLKILYIYRTTSEVARKFQTGSYYLENTGNFDPDNVLFLKNEYINSYRKAGNIYVPKFQYFSVDLKKDNEHISYSRELESYGSITKDAENAEKKPVENLKKKTMLIKNVKYDPGLWRNSMFLLPDLKMFEQVKFLNEVTIY